MPRALACKLPGRFRPARSVHRFKVTDLLAVTEVTRTAPMSAVLYDVSACSAVACRVNNHTVHQRVLNRQPSCPLSK